MSDEDIDIGTPSVLEGVECQVVKTDSIIHEGKRIEQLDNEAFDEWGEIAIPRGIRIAELRVVDDEKTMFDMRNCFSWVPSEIDRLAVPYSMPLHRSFAEYADGDKIHLHPNLLVFPSCIAHIARHYSKVAVIAENGDIFLVDRADLIVNEDAKKYE